MFTQLNGLSTIVGLLIFEGSFDPLRPHTNKVAERADSFVANRGFDEYVHWDVRGVKTPSLGKCGHFRG